MLAGCPPADWMVIDDGVRIRGHHRLTQQATSKPTYSTYFGDAHGTKTQVLKGSNEVLATINFVLSFNIATKMLIVKIFE